jgi:predicted nucleotidyltransferase
MSDETHLMDLLFTALRQRVMAELLLQPETTFHLRELARRTGSHVGTLARELEKLTQAGLLLRSQQGNQVHYRANVDHLLYPDLAALFQKTHGVGRLMQQALLELDEKIESAFIYGSMANRTATTRSDIDVLVIGTAAFAELVRVLHPLQEILRREINPVLYSGKEFASRLKRGDAFATTLAANPRIWIKGTDDDLAKLAGHKAAAGP